MVVKPLRAPLILRYAVFADNFRGRKLGLIEHSTSLQDAAIMAAIMLNRADARPVASLLNEERGAFVAYGRVPWIAYAKKEVIKELRYALVMEKEK